jgi:SAM-dependent methyltransferase
MDSRKKLVRDCYDSIADIWANANRRRAVVYPKDGERERVWYERFAGMLPQRARVLDLGCGNGEPLLADLLARGFRAVGIDLSQQQLVRAHARCPDALVLRGDMSEVAFADASFDGIVSYHSIFHVPREEHAAIFARARRWLADGGIALFTMAEVPADEFVDGPGLFTQLEGAPTFYDAHPADVPHALIAAAGFDIIDCYRPSSEDDWTGVLTVLARASRA